MRGWRCCCCWHAMLHGEEAATALRSPTRGYNLECSTAPQAITTMPESWNNSSAKWLWVAALAGSCC